MLKKVLFAAALTVSFMVSFRYGTNVDGTPKTGVGLTPSAGACEDIERCCTPGEWC